MSWNIRTGVSKNGYVLLCFKFIFRTKKFHALEIDENECSTEYLIEILIKNPSMIKLPIIIDEKR